MVPTTVPPSVPVPVLREMVTVVPVMTGVANPAACEVTVTVKAEGGPAATGDPPFIDVMLRLVGWANPYEAPTRRRKTRAMLCR
jgi:hypothetical protein